MKALGLAVIALCLFGVSGTWAATPDRVILPATVSPSHYQILITPNAKNQTFTGNVQIDIDVKRPTATIVLNAADLSFSRVELSGAALPPKVTLDKSAQTATLVFAAPIAPGHHVLTIAYSGIINQHAAGLFYLDYDSPSGKKRALYTQFENSDARRFMPCWDEPAIKATFSLTAIVPSGEMPISNTPVMSREHLADGLDKVTFSTTPKMSSYLLFFGLGDFERISKKVNGVDVGVIVKRGETQKAVYALDAAAHILPFYEDYFGVKYPLPKLDLVAGPGQSQFFSAMENWGAIFYFDRALLIDPKLSTEEDKLYVYIVVAHEMSHQWFGDLVTMAWWDDLWLNEGFASWMELKATDHFHPEWKLWLRGQDDKQSAMSVDARAGTHPIIQPIANVLQANQAFDSITYLKGMAVIRMLENYVGADAFRAGVRSYIKSHAYGNTVTDDLWREMDKTGHTPITQVAHDFTLQAGIPLIRVSQKPGQVELSQDRFAADDSGRTPTVWHVPVFEKPLAGGDGWRGLVSRQAPVTIQTPDKSVPIVNIGQAGYYHTLYSPDLVSGLAANFSNLSSADQIGILRDSRALGLAGYEPLSDALLFSQRSKARADPLVLTPVADGLAGLAQYYRDLPGKQAYEAFVRPILQPEMARIGWTAASNEDPNVTILRSHLLSALSEVDDPVVIAKARDLFERFVTDQSSLSADMRTAVLRIVAVHADAKTWSQLHTLSITAKTTLEKQQYYGLLAAARDRSLAERALAITLTDEADISQRPSIIRAVSRYYPEEAFAFALAHLNLVNQWLEPDSRDQFEVGLLSSSFDPAAIEKLKAYAAAHIPPSAQRPARMAEAQIAYAIKVRKERLPEIDHWLSSAKESGSNGANIH